MAKVKIVKPAQGRRGILQRGVLAYKDILDQPKAKYVVCVDPSPVQSMIFFADEIVINGERVTLSIGMQIVAEFQASIPWYAVASAYVDIVTTEDVAKYTAADHASMHDFEKILAPISGECDNKAGAIAGAAPQALDGTGQYL